MTDDLKSLDEGTRDFLDKTKSEVSVCDSEDCIF